MVNVISIHDFCPYCGAPISAKLFANRVTCNICRRSYGLYRNGVTFLEVLEEISAINRDILYHLEEVRSLLDDRKALEQQLNLTEE